MSNRNILVWLAPALATTLTLGVAALPNASTSPTPNPKAASKPAFDNSGVPGLLYRSLGGRWTTNFAEPIQLRQSGNYVRWSCMHFESKTKKFHYLFQGQIKGTLLEGDFVEVTLSQNPLSGHVVFKLDGPKHIRLKSNTTNFPTLTLEKVEDENTTIPPGQRCMTSDDILFGKFHEWIELSRKNTKH